MEKDNLYITTIYYKGEGIVFREDDDKVVHGSLPSTEEEFWMFGDGRGNHLMDYVVKGVYVGSLKGATREEIFDMLKSGEGWETNLFQLYKK